MNTANDFRSRLILRVHSFGNRALSKGNNKLMKRTLLLIYKILDKIIIQLMLGAEFPAEIKLGTNITLAHGGQGVIISPDAVIGDNAIIYHQVTIGGLGLGHYGEEYLKKHKGKLGVPVIGNNVFIGAGAKILGPVKIGDGAKVGANAVVTKNVPKNATAVGIPAKIIQARYDNIAT